MQKFINKEIIEKEWKQEKISYNLFKWYFNNNKDASEINCKNFFKEYVKYIFKENEDILKEIKKCKISTNYTKTSYKNMFDKLTELKDKENNKITHVIEYEHFNKIKKLKETLIMYFIINKAM